MKRCTVIYNKLWTAAACLLILSNVLTKPSLVRADTVEVCEEVSYVDGDVCSYLESSTVDESGATAASEIFDACIASGATSEVCSSTTEEFLLEQRLESVQMAEPEEPSRSTKSEVTPTTGTPPTITTPTTTQPLPPKPAEKKYYVCESVDELKECIRKGCKGDLRWNNGVPTRQGGQYELGTFDCRISASVGAYICAQRGMKSCLVVNNGEKHAKFGVVIIKDGKPVWVVVDWGLSVEPFGKGDTAVVGPGGALLIPIDDPTNVGKLPTIVPGYGKDDFPVAQPPKSTPATDPIPKTPAPTGVNPVGGPGVKPMENSINKDKSPITVPGMVDDHAPVQPQKSTSTMDLVPKVTAPTTANPVGHSTAKPKFGTQLKGSTPKRGSKGGVPSALKRSARSEDAKNAKLRVVKGKKRATPAARENKGSRKS